MKDTSNTTDTVAKTAADVLAAVRDIPASAAPQPRIELAWHGCDETALRAIMTAFPDAGWHPQENNGTEWITGRAGTVRLVAFAVDPDPKPASRLAALLRSPAEVSA